MPCIRYYALVFTFVLYAGLAAQPPAFNSADTPLVIRDSDPDLSLDIDFSVFTSDNARFVDCANNNNGSAHLLIVNESDQPQLILIDLRESDFDTAISAFFTDPETGFLSQVLCENESDESDAMIVIVPPRVEEGTPSLMQVQIQDAGFPFKQIDKRLKMNLKVSPFEDNTRLIPLRDYRFPVDSRGKVTFRAVYEKDGVIQPTGVDYSGWPFILDPFAEAEIEGVNENILPNVDVDNNAEFIDPQTGQSSRDVQVHVTYIGENVGMDQVTLMGVQGGRIIFPFAPPNFEGTADVEWVETIANDRCEDAEELTVGQPFTQDVTDSSISTSDPGVEGCIPPLSGALPNRTSWYKFTNDAEETRCITVKVDSTFSNLVVPIVGECGFLTAGACLESFPDFGTNPLIFRSERKFILQPGEMIRFMNLALFNDESEYEVTVEVVSSDPVENVACEVTFEQERIRAASEGEAEGGPVDYTIRLIEPETGEPVVGADVMVTVKTLTNVRRTFTSVSGSDGFVDDPETGLFLFRYFADVRGIERIEVTNLPDQTPQFFCAQEVPVVDYLIVLDDPITEAEINETLTFTGTLTRTALNSEPAGGEVIEFEARTEPNGGGELVDEGQVVIGADGRFEIMVSGPASRGALFVTFSGNGSIDEYPFETRDTVIIKDTPMNNEMSDAQLISELDGQMNMFNQNILDATTSPSDPVSPCVDDSVSEGRGENTVWYELDKRGDNDNSNISLSTQGSGFDTFIEIYEVGPDDELFPILCANDVPADTNFENRLSESVNFTAEAGKRYFIKTGRAGGNIGDGMLKLTVGSGKQLTVAADREFIVIGAPEAIVTARLADRANEPQEGELVTIRESRGFFPEETQTTDSRGIATFAALTSPFNPTIYTVLARHTDTQTGAIYLAQTEITYARIKIEFSKLTDCNTCDPGTEIQFAGKAELEIPRREGGEIIIDTIPLDTVPITITVNDNGEQTFTTETDAFGNFTFSYTTSAQEGQITISAAVTSDGATANSAVFTINNLLVAENANCATPARVVTTGPDDPKGVLEFETPYVDLAPYANASASAPGTLTCPGTQVSPVLFYTYLNKLETPVQVNIEVIGEPGGEFEFDTVFTVHMINSLADPETGVLINGDDNPCSIVTTELQCFDESPGNLFEASGSFVAQPGVPYLISAGTNNQRPDVLQVSFTTEEPQIQIISDPILTTVPVDNGQEREFSFAFTVTEDGEPLPDFPVLLNNGFRPEEKLTDENGQVTDTITVGAGRNGLFTRNAFVQIGEDTDIPIGAASGVYIVDYECSVQPSGVFVKTGSQHNVTATVTLNGDVAPDGTPVTFLVRNEIGEDVAEPFNTFTVNGVALFDYTSEEGANHTITVRVDGSHICEATVFWTDLLFTLIPESATVNSGQPQIFTFTMNVNELPQPNLPVDIRWTSGPLTVIPPVRLFTDDQGEILYPIINYGGFDLGQVQFSGDVNGIPFQAASTLSVLSAPDCNLTTTDDPLPVIGTTAFVVYQLSDSQGNPIEGVVVDFEVTDGPNRGQLFSATTNSSGLAIVNYTSDVPGEDRIFGVSFVNGQEISCQASQFWQEPPLEIWSIR